MKSGKSAGGADSGPKQPLAMSPKRPLVKRSSQTMRIVVPKEGGTELVTQFGGKLNLRGFDSGVPPSKSLAV